MVAGEAEIGGMSGQTLVKCLALRYAKVSKFNGLET